MARPGYRVAAHLCRTDSIPVLVTDAELLGRFAATHDEEAFTELVSRHRRLVHATARRYLGDPHTADDVAQATFLVLAAKASSVSWGATVGPWLYETAVRLSRKASRRLVPILAPPDIPSPQIDTTTTAEWAEIARLLDQELAALPELVRGPLVLCYLQGRTRDEAANALGCSLAKLKRRLERGRRLLRDRLTRRGVTLPMVGLTLLMTDLPSTASTSAAIARAAVEYATLRKAPASVAALLGGTSGSFGLKVAALGILAASLAVCCVALVAFRGVDEPKPTVKSEGSQMPTTARADTQGDRLPPSAVARLGSVRLRTSGAVERMAFSPDGTKIASWSGDSHVNDSLIIWDTKTGAALRRVDLPGARVDGLVWLADGRGIALVRSSFDETVPLIWEFTDEKAEKPQVKPRERTGKVVIVPENVEDHEYDSCYTISPDGKMLAVGKAGQLQKDREVQLWELKTGVKVDTLKPLKGGVIHPVNCGEIYFTPDAKTLVVFTLAKSLGDNKFESELLVTVWDVATSKEKSRFKAPRPATNGRSAVALSNSTLAIGLEKGDTSLWDLTTGKERMLATEHNSKKAGQPSDTYSVVFTPDGKILATGGGDNITKLWDVASGKLLHKLAGHHTWVETLAAAPGGKLIASAGQDGMIRLWDPATGADACPLPGHKYIVANVAFSADGKTAITGGWDNTLRWWDPATGAERRVVAVPAGIMGLVLSPDGKTILVATDGGELLMWDTASGREMKPADLPRDVKFESLAFTPDGRHLIASFGPKVSILVWPSLKLARTIDLPKPDHTVLADPPPKGENACQVAAVSPDGKWLVTIAERRWFVERDGLRFGYGADGVVDLWDFATGKRIRRLVQSSGKLRSGAFTADGLFVLIGAGGTIPAHESREADEFPGEMNVLDPVAGRRVRGFETPPAAATVSLRYTTASALSTDGRSLYVSYNTGEIIAYEVATGKPRRTITGHSGYITSLAFSPDGRRLLSGGNDGTSLVWDATLPGSAAPRRAPLTEAEADKLWLKASTGETRAAFTALAELATSPDSAVATVRRHVRPAPAAPTDMELDWVFTDLGSAEFEIREKASKALSEYGEGAVPGVRKKLEGDVGTEAHQRATAFLKEFQGATPRPFRVSQSRAVELLEGLGTPEAKKLLTELSKGTANAPLTLDATAALNRLGNSG